MPEHDLGALILLGALFLDVINLGFGLFLVIKHPMELFITPRVFNLQLWPDSNWNNYILLSVPKFLYGSIRHPFTVLSPQLNCSL